MSGKNTELQKTTRIKRNLSKDEYEVVKRLVNQQ